jgi:hypothetical protein
MWAKVRKLRWWLVQPDNLFRKESVCSMTLWTISSALPKYSQEWVPGQGHLPKKQKYLECTFFCREKTPTALYFKYNTQLGPPYQVLVDTNFINFSIRNKVRCHPAVVSFPDHLRGILVFGGLRHWDSDVIACSEKAPQAASSISCPRASHACLATLGQLFEDLFMCAALSNHRTVCSDTPCHLHDVLVTGCAGKELVGVLICSDEVRAACRLIW